MHAWLCENPTGVDALTWKELPTPAPGPGQVLIEIRAASLNFPDLLIVQNKYQIKPPLPFVPGSEYAGVVQAVGEGVTHLKVGQNVACLSGTGGFATHTLAAAALCMPMPEGFGNVALLPSQRLELERATASLDLPGVHDCQLQLQVQLL